MRRQLAILSPAAVVFLAFGVWMMITAYYQTDPFVFLALFFSSSLIILLSAACLIGLAFRLGKPADQPVEEEDAPPNQ